MSQQKRTGISKAVVSEDGGPDRMFGVWVSGDDPEALHGVVNERDGFLAQGGDGPVLAQEVEGSVGVEPALVIEGQMEVQEWRRRHGQEPGAFFGEGFVPSGVGSQAGGAADVVLVVPVQLVLEELIGGLEVGDAFVGQERDEPFLKGVEAAFNFAFGGGVGRDAVGDPQGGEGALELGMGVEAIGGGAMAEERQAVGVEGHGRAVLFDGSAQVAEVTPGGVAGDEGAGDDFAGVIVGGEDERGINVGRPPGMGRGIVLPEFADVGALPAAAGFGAGRLRGDVLGEVLLDVVGDRGAGAVEVQTARQFVGQEGEVEGVAVREDVGQKIMSGLGPGRVVIAAGRFGREASLVGEPLMAQFIEAGASDQEAFGGGGGIELAGVEGFEDLLDVERRGAPSELFLFIGAGG